MNRILVFSLSLIFLGHQVYASNSESCRSDLVPQLVDILKSGTTLDLQSILAEKPCLNSAGGAWLYSTALTERKVDPVEHLKLLRAAGANFIIQGRGPKSPIQDAVTHDHEKSFDFLVSEGASTKYALWFVRKNASITQKLLILEELEYNPRREKTQFFFDLSPEVFKLLFHENVIDPYHQDRSGNTFMHSATADDYPKLMKAMDLGVKVNISNNYGQTPFAEWITFNCSPYWNNCPLVDYALGRPGIIDTQETNQEGQTPLMLLVEKTKDDTSDRLSDPLPLERITKFVEYGFDINATDNAGRTVLDYAHRSERKVRKHLILLGARAER